MCGRYTLSTPGDLLAEELGLAEAPEVVPRYNIAPTQQSLIVVRPERAAARLGRFARWGFGPVGSRVLINARSETAAQKAAFARSFARRRCLVPADGFYEWQGARGRRRPVYFSPADGRPMALAGLWEKRGSGLEFVILTTASNERVAAVHDRMPVILDRSFYEPWLGSDTPPEDLAAVLAPYPSERLLERPVSRTVNDVRNDSPACLEPPRETQMDLLTYDPHES